MHAENILNVLCKRKLLNVSAHEFNTFLDCIATNNMINNNSCKSRKTAQDSFLATSEISRSQDGKGINSCLNLHALMNCAKNLNALNNADSCAKTAYSASHSFTEKGELCVFSLT